MSLDAGHPSWWDPYSNQPYKLAGASKPRLTAANVAEYARVAATLLGAAPELAARLARTAVSESPGERLARDIPPARFLGLGISPDKRYRDQIRDMVQELGAGELLIRIPTWDLARLDDYAGFAEQFADRSLLFNVLQCRDSVVRPDAWRQALRAVFARLKHLSPWFQVGNAINRTKWGCAHSGEYLDLLEIAESLRAEHPEIKLVGPSVIDFEPLVFLRTLRNRRRYHLDAVSALLYVNRRGSPYGRQYLLFDLKRKLQVLRAMTDAGNRNEARLWITEFNWPLLDTRPYTPNSGHPSRTVDEETQARYLTDYCRIARRSGWVERIYWWELINPGYGLVDHRGGGLRKMPSYQAFRDLLAGGLDQPPSGRP